MFRVKAIRVACQGELSKGFQVKEYSTYDILSDHDIFAKGATSPLSELIGLPLVLLPLRPSLRRPTKVMGGNRGPLIHSQGAVEITKRGKRLLDYEYCLYGYNDEDEYFPNPMAAALMTCCAADASGTPLLQTPHRWTDKVGSVLIARKDGRPLHAVHLAIMISFPASVLQGCDEITEGNIKESLTPEAFKTYYENALQYLVHADASQDWKEVPPLFESA